MKRRKKRLRNQVFGISFAVVVLFNLKSFSNSTWHVPETETSHANLSRVGDGFTGESHRSRETGPPEQPHREVRRPLAQSRTSAAPQTNTRPSQTQFFIPPFSANHTSVDQVTTSLRGSIAVFIPVAAACVGLQGCASHEIHPKSDNLSGGAGRNHRPLTAAPRGRPGPLLASLVALWCVR